MKNFKTLNAWKLGKDIAVKVYRFTSEFNAQEQFIFASQMARAAISIPSNVAEGNSRQSNKDYARFIEIALGSAFELETQLIIVQELSIGEESLLNEVMQLLTEEQKILYGLLRRLRSNS